MNPDPPVLFDFSMIFDAVLKPNVLLSPSSLEFVSPRPFCASVEMLVVAIDFVMSAVLLDDLAAVDVLLGADGFVIGVTASDPKPLLIELYRLVEFPVELTVESPVDSNPFARVPILKSADAHDTFTGGSAFFGDDTGFVTGVTTLADVTVQFLRLLG